MLTRRDVATLIWYALLFSAIVLWASLRTSGETPNSPRAVPRAGYAPDAPDTVDRAENQQEMRRVVQRMTR